MLVNGWLVVAVLALCCCHLSTSFTLDMAAPPSSNNRRGSSYSSGKGSNPYSKGSYSKGPSSYDSYKGNGGKSDYSNKKTFAPSPIMSEVRLGEEERLQKILARAGIASRRNAETMVS